MARGVWGGISTWQDDKGDRYLYVPMWGPPAKDSLPVSAELWAGAAWQRHGAASHR